MREVVLSAVKFLRSGGREAEFPCKNASVRLIRRGRWVRISVSALADGAMLYRESSGKAIDAKAILNWLRSDEVPPDDTVTITRQGQTLRSTAREAADEWDLEDLQMAGRYLAGLI